MLALLASGISQPLFGASAKAEGGQLVANIDSVEVFGGPGSYTFSVGILSPDTGCDQYADWWEVVSLEGELVFRNTLAHSHVNEQPFIRASGPVDIEADTVVWVRAHMFPTGYGGVVFRGTVESGFRPAEPPTVFGPGLEDLPPQPPACAF